VDAVHDDALRHAGPLLGVAAERPLGRYDQRELALYFLATFLVRQLTGSWAAWEINFEVRQGTLSTRLLRPVHPLYAYAVDNLAAIPLRMVLVGPVFIGTLLHFGVAWLPSSAALWAALFAAVLGGWLITFLINAAIGSLALYMESSVKLIDLYLVGFFVFSGTPSRSTSSRAGSAPWETCSPFRYQIALPVEVLTSAHGEGELSRLLLQQWGMVALLLTVTLALWSRAVRRYGAFGG
jgi:ABC-2 type transport system permease protein